MLPLFIAGFVRLYRADAPVGVVYAAPLDIIAKADASERWITLKPHSGSESYVHVKIRVTPEGHGHVIGGPGELRGLKLTRLSTPEELKAKAAARGKEQRAAQKSKLEAETPEAKVQRETLDATRKTRSDEIHKQLETVRGQALQHAAALTGDANFTRSADPDTVEAIRTAAELASGSANMGEGATRARGRAVDAALARLDKHLVTNLRDDAELRAAILGNGDTLEQPSPSGKVNAGFANDLSARAAAAGFTPEDAQREGEDIWQRRINEISKDDPTRAANMQAGRDRMRQIGAQIKQANVAGQAALPTPSDRITGDLSGKAETARKLLQATRAMRQLQAELRRVNLENDPDASDAEKAALEAAQKPVRGSPLEVNWENTDPAFSAELESRINDAANEDLTRSFLGSMDGDAENEFDANALREAMRAPHASGAYAHLNNVALTALGSDVLDRSVVDALGVDAAAKLTAHAMRRDLTPDDLERVSKGLKTYHSDASLTTMRDALETAKTARATASSIQIPPISSSDDAHAAQLMIDAKREALQRAHKALGVALGQVEAGAALNLTLGQRQDGMIVNLSGLTREGAATNLRGLGLRDGDYEIAQDKAGAIHASINRAGMDRLTPSADPAERELERRVNGIKNGDEDQPDWLPAGFVKYPDLQHDAPTLTSLAVAPDFTKGTQAGLEQVIGSRLADGWSPAEVAQLIRSQDFKRDWIPSDAHAEFAAAADELMPATSGFTETPMKDGSGGTFKQAAPVDYANLEAKHPEIHAKLTELAKAHGDASGYASQDITDTPAAKRALHAALLTDPATRLAFHDLGDLTPQHQSAMRRYFASSILGMTPEQQAEGSQRAKQNLEKYDTNNPEPTKFHADTGLFSMFGDGDAPGPTTLTLPDHLGKSDHASALRRMGLAHEGEHYTPNSDGSITLTPAGEKALRPPPPDLEVKGSDALNPEWTAWHSSRAEAASSASEGDAKQWPDFVSLTGGVQRAYEAVQEHMKGQLLSRFAQNHGATTGKTLRLGKVQNKFGAMLMAMQDPEAYKRYQADQRASQDELRERAGGQFSDMGGRGSLNERDIKRREADEAERNAGGMLFAPSADEATAKPALIPHLERAALPRQLEQRLKAITSSLAPNLEHVNATEITPNITMGKGTKYTKQQRAIRMLEAGGKMAAFFGTGCVHPDTVLEDAVSGERLTFEQWMFAQRAPRVLSWDVQNNRFVVAQANIPFIKGYEQMFQFVFDDGRSISVTANHRFLTSAGWKFAYEVVPESDHAQQHPGFSATWLLGALASNPLERTCPQSELPALPLSAFGDAQASKTYADPAKFFDDALRNVRSGHDVYGMSHLQTTANSQFYYLSSHRFYDAQLRAARGSAQYGAPSQADVPAQRSLPLHEDGPLRTHSDSRPYSNKRLRIEGEASRPENPLCNWLEGRTSRELPLRGLETRSMYAQSHRRLSPVRATHATASLQLLDRDAPTIPAFCNAHSRSGATLLSDQQFRAPVTPERANASTPPRLQSENAAWLTDYAWRTVRTIRPIGAHAVFDIHVPIFENYVSHGVVNHNSGKTNIAIGAFSHLHAQGKVKHGIVVCPSIVRSQFAETMAANLEPGAFKWHAHEASYPERLAAYQNPDTHMVVVTHQSFRDDMARMIADAHNLEPEDAKEMFHAAPRERRATMLKRALEHHGVNLDYLMADEAHEALNRAGKEESFLSAVLDTAVQHAKYAMLATGSPIKNDATEAQDWAAKLSPERFGDRDQFMRRYGADMQTNKEALKRVLNRYAYTDVVPAHTVKTVTWGDHARPGSSPSGHTPIRLTPWQQSELEKTDQAYSRARRARAAGKVDIEAMRTLNPRAFAGKDEARHAGIATRLQSSLGTIRHSAHSRIINDAPAEHNAKIQHTLQIAGERRGKGGVIFAHGRESVRQLESALKAQGHRVITLTGSDNADDKARARARFNGGEADIIVCSDAGAVGANLQHRGEYLINHDLPMTQKTLEQRNARIDRLGQHRPIELFHSLSGHAHDAANLKRLETKRMLGSILQGEHENLDDTGLAKYIRGSSLERAAGTDYLEPDAQDAPPEDDGGLFANASTPSTARA